jgi:hypothetical protein
LSVTLDPFSLNEQLIVKTNIKIMK